MKKVWMFALVSLVLAGLSLPSRMVSGQEKLQFGAAFRGSARYDLVSWVAENKGYWKEQGLKVEWIPFKAGSLMFRTVAAGKLFIGVTSIGSFIQAASRGVKVVIIADLKSPQYFALWVKGDGPIKKGEDLRGGRIGISRKGGSSHAYAKMLSRRLGIEKDVRFIGLGAPRVRVASLKSGAIEAFIQTMNPIANLVASGEVRELISSKEIVPKGYIDYLMFSEKGFLEREPDTVARALKAVLQSVEYIANNPAWTKKKIQQDFGFTEKGAELTMTEMDFTGAGRAISPEAVEATVDFFVKNKIIKRAPPREGLYTNKFVR